MTAVDARPEPAAQPAPPPVASRRAEALPAAALAVAWLGLVAVSVRGGGRDRNAVLLGLLTLVPALLVLRPDRHVPRRAWAAAAAVPAAAVLSCLLAPRAWAGAGEVAVWAYAALAFGTVRAYATTARRRAAVGLAVAALGAHQVYAALTPWLGGGDPARPMIGTFYWHNQFAVWVAAAGLAGGAAALLARRWSATGGGAAFALCAAGVVLSTSRATLGLAALLWLALGAAAVRARGARAAARWAGSTVAAAALATLLASPLVFGDAGGGAFDATARRGAGQSVEGNAGYRLDYWRAALAVTAEHPLVGTGAGGYKTAALDHLPAGMQGSPFVHNGVLQGAAEGGLPLGLALAAAVALGALAALRRVPEALRRNDFGALGLAAAALVLLGHALLDFDTTYPALPVLAAVAAGGLGARTAARTAARGVPRAALALLLVTGVATAAADDAVRAATGHVAPENAAAARAAFAAERMPDPRVAGTVLLAALPEHPGQEGLRLPEDVVRRALRETAEAARVDAGLALRRLEAEALLGDTRAPDRAAAIAAPRATRRPFLVTLHADVLAAAGRPGEAAALVLGDVRTRATPGYPRPAEVWEQVAYLLRNDAGPAAACAAGAAEAAFGPAPAPLAAAVAAARRAEPCR
ncbi:MAG TPA: O-antigen ligase family protein [Mycobacteriales bacterium]|nr:O-antigen ligase family protein [Mycobacteriales bacterium]